MKGRGRYCRAGALALAFGPWLGACGVDLPKCDEEAARTPAYAFDDGAQVRVAYEGQALMIRSCGYGTFCHAPDIEPSSRFGAPAGLDYDVRPVTGDDADRLREMQREVFDDRHAIAFQVAEGFMPPGRRGKEVVQSDIAPRYVRGPTPDAEPLPGLDEPEGRQTLENWLACRTPVVEETREAAGGLEPGAPCGRGEAGVGEAGIGDCIVRPSARPIEPPEPTWTAIYAEVIEPECTQCHAPDGISRSAIEALDLSTQMMAYEQLVGREAMGSACGGMGTLVVPGDPDASLLVQKLELATTDPEQCGTRMPVTGDELPAELIAPIRQWIADGAVND